MVLYMMNDVGDLARNKEIKVIFIHVLHANIIGGIALTVSVPERQVL